MSSHLLPIWDKLSLYFQILGYCLATIWGVSIFNFAIGRKLNRWGILPRTQSGLFGIFLAPLLHGSWQHLLGNTPPFLILGWFILLLAGPIAFGVVTVVTGITSGLAVWCLGANQTYIGASRVIFGYFGFLLLRGYFQESVEAVLASITAACLYGWMAQGMLPGRARVGNSRISWEGHLFGFISGVWVARYLEELQPWVLGLWSRLQTPL